jgi:Plavaka transposase
MYCPIILGSDKTTVSVATGHVEYHPLYLSIGNLHNTVRRAHRNGVIPIAFLAIPKSMSSIVPFIACMFKTCILGDRRYDDDPKF